MKRRLVVVSSAADLRNVVFLDDSTLSTVDYKRIRLRDMTPEDSGRLHCLVACDRRTPEGGRCSCKKTCIWAVVRRKPAEKIALEILKSEHII